MDSKVTRVIKSSWLTLAFVAILASPVLALIAPQDGGCLHEYHWLEAECGEISAPGEIGSDPEASEGAYLTTPPGSGRFIDQQAGPLIATYDYTLNYDCHNFYYLWVRVKYHSFEHNSIWVAFDHSSNFAWRFSDQQTGHWHWERLGAISGLWKGDHKLFVKLREEQTQIDKFLMTSDPRYTPTGLGDPAANRCTDPTPVGEAECDLCDPKVNLGDLVVLNDPYFPDDAYQGWPAIVVGQEAGHYALLTHRELSHMAPYAKSPAAQGQGYPYNLNRYRIAVAHPDPSRHTIIVPEHSIEQYIDCRGLLSFQFDPQSNTFTGSFRSDEGFSGDIEIMPGVVPDGISVGDNDNMRLQGMLHSSENTVFYPVVSSTLHPLAREGEVVIREIANNPYPPANTYGLGVVECWNLDRPGQSKIISLTDLLGFGGPRDGVGTGLTPPSDSERLSCMTVHLRPSPFDFTETGTFISYVCTDCGVIRRINTPHTKFDNGRMSDSGYALVFQDTDECYVLPEGINVGSWADLEGEHYRLVGFREYADPAGTGFGQVSIGGVPHRRLGFLAAPVALFPCGKDPVKKYTLEVSSSNGGHVTPAEGTFSFEQNAQVTLTAVPDAGYIFDGWTITNVQEGTVKPDHATITFTMNGNYRFHANFKRKVVTYTLNVSSDNGGHVTPAEGTSTHNAGTVITLTAVPNNGYTFEGWTTIGVPGGTINPANASISFAMHGNYSFHANFKRIPAPVKYTLKVSSGNGGHVTPAEGSFTHAPGTWVALMAVADPGYVFDKWVITGLPAGTIDPSRPMAWFAMNGDYALHATFKRTQPVSYTLKVSSDNGGHVKPSEGTSTHSPGSLVSLTAVANSGYVFDGWTTTGIPAGTINPASPTVSFAMNGNYTFHAKFKRVPQPSNYTLKVSSDNGGKVIPAEGTFTFAPGTWVALMAVADPGYTFDGWATTGVPAGTINPGDAMVFFPMNGNYTFHARFKSVAQHRPNLTDGGLLYRDIHPQVVQRGGTVNVSFRLRNNGAASAADGSGLIRIAYFASTDTTITSADHPLGDEFTWSLPAGQSRDLTVPLKVPFSLPRGTYYVGWIIDPLNNIQESNENDNVAHNQSKKLTVQ